MAQIRFYLVILWKSQEISLLIKVFCLLSDYSKTCTKCRSTIEDLFHKVSLKLVKRWRIFINGEFHKYLLRKIRSSWIWATPVGAHTRGRFAAGLSHVLRNDQMPYILAFALHVWNCPTLKLPYINLPYRLLGKIIMIIEIMHWPTLCMILPFSNGPIHVSPHSYFALSIVILYNTITLHSCRYKVLGNWS